MYSKQEAAQLKKEFWTVFGQYMTPVLSAEGEKISWINYKTGVKDLFFRMEAYGKEAALFILISHSDLAKQQLFFEQFATQKNLFFATAGADWTWQLHTADSNGKTVSKIVTMLDPVSIYSKQDWPPLISFFKSRLVALDEFWSGARYGFEIL